MSKVIDILKHRNYVLLHSSNDFTLMKDENENNIIIFICNDNLTINFLKVYIKHMNDSNITHSIVIYKDKITPSAKKVIETTELDIETFTTIEMSIDITKHKYYCPHIKVENHEANLLATKYGNKLPIILKTDPVVKILNFKKGDILKIIRKNNYVHYRIVK